MNLNRDEDWPSVHCSVRKARDRLLWAYESYHRRGWLRRSLLFWHRHLWWLSCMDLNRRTEVQCRSTSLEHTDRSFDQLSDEIFELRTCNLIIHMLGTGGIHGQIGQIDISLQWTEKIDVIVSKYPIEILPEQPMTIRTWLFPQLLSIAAWLGDLWWYPIHSRQTRWVNQSMEEKGGVYFFLELSNEMFQQGVVEIFTTQECITIGGTHFEDVRLHFQNGDIEGTTTKIVDRNTRTKPLDTHRVDRKGFVYILSFVCSRP